MKRIITAISMVLVGVMTFAANRETKAEPKAEPVSVAITAVSLSGNVIDEISGEALVGVEVKVDGSEVKTYTDFDGHFVLNNVKAGECKLVASYTSYNKLEKTVQLESKTNQIKIELQTSK